MKILFSKFRFIKKKIELSCIFINIKEIEQWDNLSSPYWHFFGLLSSGFGISPEQLRKTINILSFIKKKINAKFVPHIDISLGLNILLTIIEYHYIVYQ